MRIKAVKKTAKLKTVAIQKKNIGKTSIALKKRKASPRSMSPGL